MLDLVGQNMRKYESKDGEKQSCSYEVIHFYKKLFFNPGLYRDESIQSPIKSGLGQASEEELELADDPSAAKIRPKVLMRDMNLVCEIEQQ